LSEGLGETDSKPGSRKFQEKGWKTEAPGKKVGASVPALIKGREEL